MDFRGLQSTEVAPYALIPRVAAIAIDREMLDNSLTTATIKPNL